MKINNILVKILLFSVPNNSTNNIKLNVSLLPFYLSLYAIKNQRNKSLLLMAHDRFRSYKLFIFKKPIQTEKKYGVCFFTPRIHTKCFGIIWPQKCMV